jgi:hypothetical protein
MLAERIREVVFEAEWEGTAYQIVRLRSGLHAFVWREPAYKLGDRITPDEWNSPTVDHGARITASRADAEHLFRTCVACIGRTDPEASQRILTALNEPTY